MYIVNIHNVCRCRNTATSPAPVTEAIFRRRWRHVRDGQFHDRCRHRRFQSNIRMRHPLPVRYQSLRRTYHHLEEKRNRGTSFLSTLGRILYIIIRTIIIFVDCQYSSRVSVYFIIIPGGPTKVKPTYIFVSKIWIKFEWIDKIQWFLVNALTVHSYTLGSIKI